MNWVIRVNQPQDNMNWVIRVIWVINNMNGVISVNQPQDNMKRNYPVVNVPPGLKRSTC